MADYNREEQSLSGHPPADVKKRDRIKFLTQEVKSNVREVLRHDDGEQATVQNEILEDAAFDPQRVLETENKPKPSLGERLSHGAKNVVSAVKNPKAASRNNYTRHAASKIADHPHDRSTAFDDELLDAHDALADAKESSGLSTQQDPVAAGPGANAAGVHEAQSRVQRIEQQREDLKTGWILGRQVMRVKVVRPIISKPDRAQFLDNSGQPGQPPHLQWGRYLGHLILWYTQSFTAYRIDDFDEPPFDLRELVLTVERLAAVSTPWQTFFTKVRDVYRWEDPRRTTQIMLTYWILWYFQHLATFGLAYVIYITIRNKLYPTNVEAIRESVQRSKDQSAKVRAWGELIQKHGGNDWIEPFFDAIGPHLQLQLGDLAILLERLQNFYRWERPRQTWLSLSLFFCCFVFSLLSSMELFIRLVSFVAGCYFFYGFPIAANYPRYRHVVSPLSWMVWGIPDSAELAIDQLQQKVVVRDAMRLPGLEQEKEALHAHQVSGIEPGFGSSSLHDDVLNTQNLPNRSVSPRTSSLLNDIRASDSLTFKTIILPDHAAANLTLTRTHIIIEPHTKSSLSHPYSSLLEVRKVDLNANSNQSSSSSDTNNLSRSAHVAKRLEKSVNMQLLPDGLGFVFLQEGGQGNGHLSELQDRQIASRTQEHATVDTQKPAPEPNSSRLPINPPHVGPEPESIAKSSSSRHRSHKTEVSLVLNKSDRDKIFTVVIAWSGLKWQPLYSMNRQNRLGNRDAQGEGNRNLDDAVKKALS
ncbi:hypothetical protein H2198_006464 [Neophaeococcomyces mojaviensis]|uniref:Uncharacterized protein n=1 Tax=Neophaeococcomyces mojaviensis TaxID=3383035 RepID=A0ACC3A340_9EURO|nr:hypothetical protein H2198_006464 [Knufia sp. JES_112]